MSDCKEPGRVRPVVDSKRCEGKEDCVAVCPTNVFEVRRLTGDERSALGLLTRLKVAVHGGKQAFVVRPGACEACSDCVRACPEKAIRLVKA